MTNLHLDVNEGHDPELEDEIRDDVETMLHNQRNLYDKVRKYIKKKGDQGEYRYVGKRGVLAEIMPHPTGCTIHTRDERGVESKTVVTYPEAGR